MEFVTCRRLVYVILLISVSIQLNEAATNISLTPFPVLTLHENSIGVVDIATVFCQEENSGTWSGCKSCNLKSVTTTASVGVVAPFLVVKQFLNVDFHVYFSEGVNNAVLNFNTISSYLLTIKCTTSDPVLSAEDVLELDILPNLAPTITNYPGVTVTLDAKNTAAGVTLDTIIAKDNESDALTFTHWFEPSLADYFSVDDGATTAIVKTIRDLRYSVYDTVLVKTNVSDGKLTTGPYTTTIRMTNLNSRPQFTNLPVNISIAENAVSGQTIIVVTFNDPDLYSTLTPVFTVDPISEAYKFVYEQNSHRIKLATVPSGATLLDAESTQLYNISGLLNDGFLDSTGEYILLTVLNVNEPPIFNEQLYYCSLVEPTDITPNPSCDLQAMSITDPEGDTIARVYLATGNNSERFRWDNSAERLSFQTGVYDVDTSGFPTSVLLTINAEDDKGETGTSQILITITDQNDNVPVFGQTIQSFSITQGVTNLGTLGTITVTDADLTSPNKDVTLALVKAVPPEGINYCNVLGNNDGTAEVRFTNTNFETSVGGTTVFLTIKASDGGTPQKTSSGTVAVTFVTTTTSTTTTSTTTTTTAATTTTTAAPGFFDVPANVAIFAILMSLLGLLLLGALFFLIRYCVRGTCTGPGGACDFSNSSNVRQVRPSYEGHEYERFRGSRNNSPIERFPRDAERRNPEQHSRPARDPGYRDPGYRDPDYRSQSYKDEFWKTSDHYEDGRPWSTSLVKLGNMSGQGARPPPAIKPY